MSSHLYLNKQKVALSDSGNEEVTPVNVGKRKQPPEKRNPRVAARQRAYDQQEQRVKELQEQMVEMSKQFEASQHSLKLASAKNPSTKWQERGNQKVKRRHPYKRNQINRLQKRKTQQMSLMKTMKVKALMTTKAAAAATAAPVAAVAVRIGSSDSKNK